MPEPEPPDPLRDAIRWALEDVRGEPDEDDLERRARRHRARRRIGAATGGVALILAVATPLVLLAPLGAGRSSDEPLGTAPSATASHSSPSPTASAGTPDQSPSGCGDPTTTVADSASVQGIESPPPVTLRFCGRALELHAHTYCYESGCVDGAPTNPPDVGSPEEIRVLFPLEGWSFTAFFSAAGERCARVQAVELEPSSDGTLLLRPAGYAGAYDVTLFGRGDGDLAATFRWRTPTDGPLPEPEARLAILSGHDGDIDSYGVELELRNLARTPAEASATVTVRSADGRSLTFEATRAKRPCIEEGTVYWDGPDEQGRAAARLGDPPFTYEVEVVLDGVRYTATARWPTDEISGNEPSVPLRFTPALPALS